MNISQFMHEYVFYIHFNANRNNKVSYANKQEEHIYQNKNKFTSNSIIYPQHKFYFSNKT